MKKNAPEAARQAFSGAFRMILSAALSCSGPGLGAPRSLSRDGRHRIPQLNQNCRRKSQILVVQPGGKGHRQRVDRGGQRHGVVSAVVHTITYDRIWEVRQVGAERASWLSSVHGEHRQLLVPVPQGQESLSLVPVSLAEEGLPDPGLLLPRLADVVPEQLPVHDKGCL